MKKEETLKRVQERCEMLAALIGGVQEAYGSATAEQQAFVETTIGAALWYLPKVEESFSGLISRKLVEKFESPEKVKVSEEHIFPRKISASELLGLEKGKLTGGEIYRLYREKFCKLCLITSEENKQAIKYQRKDAFTSPLDAYQEAKIELIKITEDELKRLKKRDKAIIDTLKHRKVVTELA